MSGLGHAAQVAGEVTRRVGARLSDVVDLMGEMVRIDSGFDNPAGVSEVERILADALADLPGANVEWRSEGGFDHVAVTLGDGPVNVAILGHADTVFPRGTAAARPMHVDGEGVAYGPGVADMKGGLAMAIHVIRALAEMGECPRVHFVVVGDEETRTTAPPFIDLLSTADACMVLECGRPDGGYVVHRKAGMWLRLNARGRSAHAGVQPDQGTSAIVGLCEAVVDVAALHRARPELTVSIGTIQGGSAPNVVAAEAWADVDIRSFSEADLDWVRGAIGDICAKRNVDVVPLGDWPPMLPDPVLSADYSRLGKEASVVLREVSTGGMSDGCWTAAAGVPTIDGVGPEGGDDHSPDEFVDVKTVPVRAGLLAGLIVATTKREVEE